MALYAGLTGLYWIQQALAKGYYVGKRNVIYATDPGFYFSLAMGGFFACVLLCLVPVIWDKRKS